MGSLISLATIRSLSKSSQWSAQAIGFHQASLARYQSTVFLSSSGLLPKGERIVVGENTTLYL